MILQPLFIADRMNAFSLAALFDSSRQFLRAVGERGLNRCLPGIRDAGDAVDVGAAGFRVGNTYLLALELLPSPAWICASRLSKRRDMSSTVSSMSMWTVELDV
jgi:hypothetical protein